MQNLYSDDRLRLAARLYYVDGLGQNGVAKFVKVSQAKVSRLLALARERGIVRITVADYEPRNRELEARLRVVLGLSEAIVIKTIEGLADADLRRAIGHFASHAVEALIQPRDVVAMAGGRTLHDLVHQLPEPRNKALTVVQTMGSVASNVSAADAQEIGRVLAHRLGGHFLSLNTPAYMPEEQTRNALLQLEQVRMVHEHLARANVALVGVGTLENSVFIERGVLGASDVAGLKEAGVIGEICGRFFDAGGNECATPWRDRVMSVTFENLRRIPRVLAVVSGHDRTQAVLAAIRGGLLKGLVIDEDGASALVAAATESAPVPKKHELPA
ncbi:MAG: sugar-binding transcriptional regulator [Opitutaceae bacterium]